MRNPLLWLLVAVALAGCHHAGSGAEGSGHPGESAANPIVLHGLEGQPAGPAEDATEKNRQLAGNLSVSVVDGPTPGQAQKRATRPDSFARRHHARRQRP